METAVIYARISSDRAEDAHGVTSQLRQCREFAESRGWEIADEYVDNDLSAYSGVTRPQFERLLTDMEHGTTAHVIAWHIDRMCRRVSDLVRITEAAKHGGVTIHTVKAGDIDLSNSSGEFMAHLLGAVAQFEARHMSERQVSSHADRAQRGVWRGGRQPFGYDRGPEAGTLVINPQQAALVQKWVGQILDGDGIMKIARETREQFAGHPDASLSQATSARVRIRLQNPAIAGLLAVRKEIVGEGNWEPIIPREQWEAVNAILSDPARRTHQGGPRMWQGSGVYLCGVCGGPVAHRNVRRRANLQDAYYCRNNDCTTLYRERADNVVNAVILAYLDQPENRISLIDRDADNGVQAAALQRDRAGLVERKDQLGLFYADGTIDAGQLAAGTREIKAKLEGIDRKLATMRVDAPLLDMALSGDDLRERWETMSADRRADVIRALMTVTILPAPKGKRVPAHDRISIDWK